MKAKANRCPPASSPRRGDHINCLHFPPLREAGDHAEPKAAALCSRAEMQLWMKLYKSKANAKKEKLELDVLNQGDAFTQKRI